MDAKSFSLDPEERDLIRSLIVADPELVLGDDQVMQRLVGETVGGRKITDLRDRLVARLESRLERLVDTHRTVIAAAYENVEGTRQVHRAVLALVEPPDLSSFLYRLTHEVPDRLGIEEARLCFEGDVGETALADGDGRVLALPDGTIDAYLMLDGAPRPRSVVLREAGSEAELIFGEANPVQSEALMRLDLGGAVALFALGSADPRKFDAGHGTDLLAFLAGVVERLLAQRLSEDG